MVRSHIGNVVCRKALCVRVASSPPKNPGFLIGIFYFYIIIFTEGDRKGPLCYLYHGKYLFENSAGLHLPLL